MLARRDVRAAFAFAACFFIAGCDGGEKKIQEIQKQADERVAQAQKEATDKVAAAQKQIEELKAQFQQASDKAKADADEALKKAAEGAEAETKLVEEALTKARQAYKAEGRARLNDINEDLKDVQQRSAKASAKARAAAQKALQEIQKKEGEIQKDIASFDEATLETFKTVKAKLDGDLAKLKQAIAAAKAKLQ